MEQKGTKFIRTVSYKNDSCSANVQKKVRKSRKCAERFAESTALKAPAPKRKKSSEKERERNEEIKAKLQYLATRIPFVQKDLSRIRTLRLTKKYIEHLLRILKGETVTCLHTGKQRPLSPNDFRQEVNRELQTNNSYKDRAEEELSSISVSAPASTSCPSRLSFTMTRENSPQSSSEICQTGRELTFGPVDKRMPLHSTVDFAMLDNQHDINTYGSVFEQFNSIFNMDQPIGVSNSTFPIGPTTVVSSSTTFRQFEIEGKAQMLRTQRVADCLPSLRTFTDLSVTSSSNYLQPKLEFHANSPETNGVFSQHVNSFYSYY